MKYTTPAKRELPANRSVGRLAGGEALHFNIENISEIALCALLAGLRAMGYSSAIGNQRVRPPLSPSISIRCGGIVRVAYQSPV